MDTNRLNVGVAGFVIIRTWFVTEWGGVGCCFLQEKKKKEEEKEKEIGVDKKAVVW
jgi:hypothetical protein